VTGTVEVEFVGGPVDGTRWVFPVGDRDGRPPRDVTIVTDDGFVDYRREVSPRDHGPLWLYGLHQTRPYEEPVRSDWQNG
jgi:hypothetical protein